MKTNVGKQFLRIVDESFPERHELRQIFRHTLNKTPLSNTHGQNAEKTDKNSSECETATCKIQIAVIGKMVMGWNPVLPIDLVYGIPIGQEVTDVDETCRKTTRIYI